MSDTKNTMSDLLATLSSSLSTEDLLFASIASNLSVEITKQRLKLGLTQTDFAKHLSVSQAMISKWEKADYNFTIKSLINLAQKLNLDLNISLHEHTSNSIFSVSSNISDTTHKNVIQFPLKNQSWSSTSSSNFTWITADDDPYEM